MWSSSHLFFSSRCPLCAASTVASRSFGCTAAYSRWAPWAGSSGRQRTRGEGPSSEHLAFVRRKPGSSCRSSGRLPEGGACALRTVCVRRRLRGFRKACVPQRVELDVHGLYPQAGLLQRSPALPQTVHRSPHVGLGHASRSGRRQAVTPRRGRGACSVAGGSEPPWGPFPALPPGSSKEVRGSVSYPVF